MKIILFVSHCILNVASKVILYDEEEINAEEDLRLKFLNAAINKGVQLVQLPCPEFTLYGANRWGHVSNQFDNPFFRKRCKEILNPIVMEIKEYQAHPDRYNVLGYLGIGGSPSCGVDHTCIGNCFGSFGGRQDLEETLNGISLANKPGIFIDELKTLLKENGIDIPVVELYANEPDKCMSLLDNIK
ncbi:MAG: hypothetical protein IK151_01640 [Erysipelotrichaceae bacterium]|nr:hypothetical protein [Erysipelotrichaceae bacterium]